MIAFVMLFACDRLSKDIAKDHLRGKETISYFHDTFKLEYVENTGAFLSLGSELSDGVSRWVFIILPLVVLGILGVYIIRNRGKMSMVMYFALILVLVGGLGNLTDRIFFNRHVTDFLNVGIGNLRTGIFNLADLYVTTGVIMLLLFSKKSDGGGWFQKKKTAESN